MMEYLLTPYCEPYVSHAWWKNAFSDSELDWLKTKAKDSSERAKVGGNLTEDNLNKIRRSHLTWIHCEDNSKWIFDRLSKIVSSINSQFYKFDLTGFGEPLQLTNYDQSERGMYGWHTDGMGTRNISRKLSLVLQLTDPSEYEGGNLQIMNSSGIPENILKEKGLIVLFPSFTLHQVTPVVQGSRQSLVAWISGPQFK